MARSATGQGSTSKPAVRNAHSARRICQADVINSQRSPGLGLTRSLVLTAFSWVLRDAVSISIRLLSILGPSRCSEGPVSAPLTITRRCGYWRARRPASRMRSLVPPRAITPMSLSGSWIFPCALPRTAPLPWPWAATPQRRAAWRTATSATGSSWLRGRRWSSERARILPIAPSLTDWGGRNVERILACPTWPKVAARVGGRMGTELMARLGGPSAVRAAHRDGLDGAPYCSQLAMLTRAREDHG